jgi:hypothetical protein
MTITEPEGEGMSRPVLMSKIIAERLNVLDRWRVVNPTMGEGGSGVADVTEAELIAYGASRVEWGEPDEHGWFTPTLYSEKRT